MEERAMIFREMAAVVANGGAAAVVARPRGVGRPSTVAQYAPQISEWLREEPVISGAEVLRRVRGAGYRGGKSALYELVRRLRQPLATAH
ncbi:MAG: hypothetical protein A2W08_18475 [Candidatus Rokubacteria bacterium RBG_16_73_20]|nr:MAG: hypothetical protein A2050_16605 [Candidatus Rokubacteria bacterium GWA2_73_35]OGK94906.1 MAG: hypothetical protein A2W08_18475 [Candidatus Rokubacteria bacterium RBG_16_73_20]